MSTNPHPQRRDFLKTAAAGAAGAMGISAFKFDKLFAQSTGGGWVTGMQINPAIDNMRVISCHDTTMITGTFTPNMAFSAQNTAVNATTVANNMDQMAMQLAQKTSAADAWSTIFRTGNAGGWASTRVAIKTNAIDGSGGNHPRVAVIKKICDVLCDQFGVSGANIVIFDARDNDCPVCYSSYCDVNDKTKIRAVVATRPANTSLTGLNGFAAVTLTNGPGYSGPADLVNGKIDILVDIAACKGHNGQGGQYSYGSVTLCMKNHFGTFTDTTQIGHSEKLHAGGTPLGIFEINKHPSILGGNPVRQQLCIVDAIMTTSWNPGQGVDNRTDRIIMGTFAPIVDYLTAKNILLNTTVNPNMPAAGLTKGVSIIPQFLTSFDYAETDPLQWIEYSPSSLPPIGGNTGSTGGTSGSGGAASGGTKASGGASNGGTSGSGGARTGGTSASGGASGSGGTSAAGGASSSGGTSGSGGASGSGGTSAAGGARTGGTSASGGAASGGIMSSSGGTTSASGGAGATGGTTSSASASGGSAKTGGTTAGNGTGGSSGSASSTAKGGNSEGGCDVAGGDRRATRWGAMLAFGAVVAEKLRRLVSGSDRSS